MSIIECDAVSFGVCDQKGREIGGRYDLREVEGGYRVEPQPTRDGCRYGATPVRAWRTLATLDEARAHARAYLEAARARAVAAHGEPCTRTFTSGRGGYASVRECGRGGSLVAGRVLCARCATALVAGWRREIG